MVIVCDGGKRGGVIYGSYKIITETEEYHRQIVFDGGISTSNESEYAILIAALKAAKLIALDTVNIITDSALVKYQIEGVYNCYSPRLNILLKQSKELLANFDDWTITLVKRNFIKQALGH